MFTNTVNQHTNVRGMSAIRELQSSLTLEGGEDDDGL